jgi:hypothetical protein
MEIAVSISSQIAAQKTIHRFRCRSTHLRAGNQGSMKPNQGKSSLFHSETTLMRISN